VVAEQVEPRPLRVRQERVRQEPAADEAGQEHHRYPAARPWAEVHPRDLSVVVRQQMQ
jgi:hypothetical protein